MEMDNFDKDLYYFMILRMYINYEFIFLCIFYFRFITTQEYTCVTKYICILVIQMVLIYKQKEYQTRQHRRINIGIISVHKYIDPHLSHNIISSTN